MKLFYLILAVLIFLLLQLVVAERITIGQIAPDFLVLIVAFFALYRRAVQGSVFGFFIGLLQDLSNPAFLGLNALTKAILGYTVGKAGSKTFPENSLFLFILFLLVSFGHDFVYLVIYHWPDLGGALVVLFTSALPSAAYTALFGLLTHKLLSIADPKVVE
jgi:rod shape-determining protein MreD